eukprot:1759797-Amphidinium_carterae.1
MKLQLQRRKQILRASRIMVGLSTPTNATANALDPWWAPQTRRWSFWLLAGAGSTRREVLAALVCCKHHVDTAVLWQVAHPTRAQWKTLA